MACMFPELYWHAFVSSIQCLNCILQSSQFYYGYYPFPSDVALKTFFLFFANDCTENVMRVQCRSAKIHKTVLQCTSPLKLYWMHYGMSFSNRANHTYEFVGCVTSGPVCRRFRHSVRFTVRCADSACGRHAWIQLDEPTWTWLHVPSFTAAPPFATASAAPT